MIAERHLDRMEIDRLLERYDVRVPRYTSYPTAPHFGPSVNAGMYGAWLAALPDDAPVSLYLHVPFCAQLCWFCGCHTTAVTRLEPLEAYADTLLREIDLVAAAIGARRLRVGHVHWGGGTPHALPRARMTEIMRRLRDAFRLAPDAEIAIEIDSRTMTDDVLEGIAEMGATRASLGVQDFDEQVQRAVNRVQSFEMTRQCADGLRALGIRSINLDLMYGLPHQTAEKVVATVDRALDVGPDRVAVFGYAHVPWLKRHQALLPEDDLPGPAERYRQLSAAEITIRDRGYVQIGLDHYARPDDAIAVAAAKRSLRRNFQGYTTDAAPVLIGLGASAIGSLPDGYAQNAAALPQYRDMVRAGTLPIQRGIAITDEDRLRRDVIEQLMCHGSVDIDDTAARHGADPASLHRTDPYLDGLAEDGLISWDGRTVRVRPQARVLVRSVAAVFDTYYTRDAIRHARAI